MYHPSQSLADKPKEPDHDGEESYNGLHENEHRPEQPGHGEHGIVGGHRVLDLEPHLDRAQPEDMGEADHEIEDVDENEDAHHTKGSAYACPVCRSIIATP